jgi:hypothetical protein
MGVIVGVFNMFIVIPRIIAVWMELTLFPHY